MQPEMLSRMVHLEHTRRLHEFEVAAALHTGDDDEYGVSTRRKGRLARLLAMRPHRQHGSTGADVVHVS
jgi:hypothetical protein